MTGTDFSPVTLVTGGAQGIGRGITLHFLRRGARVVLADIDEEAGLDLLSLLPAGQREKALFIPADVGDEQQVRHLVSEAAGRFGSLEVLINNAGIADPESGPVEELPLSRWDRVLRTNLTGTFLCSKHCVPLLRRSGRGAIVNLCSTRAFMSEPHTESYAATKGGIHALTHALAVSLGPDIRVNAISPGWIEVGDYQKTALRSEPHHRPVDREQHPAGRVGTPEDIAALAWFLCSPAAGFITGENIVADGGMTRKMIYAH
jgi:NAD(P)-dependent dehydrogenase (short-subunit alcohol dehydrogenase family)